MPGLDIHAGIWRALEAAGIRATAVAGTSAGAICSAYDSSGWDADQFESFLRGIDDSAVRHERMCWPVRIPWLESIHDNDRIRNLLATTLPPNYPCFEKPFSAWATRLSDGERVNVFRTELTPTPAEAVLASMSICGLFPAVTLADGDRIELFEG